MRYALIFALALAAVTSAACSSGPEVQGNAPQPVGGGASPQRGTWSKYIQVMTERERMAFFDLIDDHDRRLWLTRNGIDVRAELAERLVRGISVDAAKRRINDPLDHEEKRGQDTMLFYSRYNTESRTNYYLQFRSDQLISWNTYTLAQQERTLGLMRFELDLIRKFDAYLEPGMGPEEIRSLATRSKKNADDTALALRDRVTDGNYKGPVEVVAEEGPDGKKVLKAKRGGSRETVYHQPWLEGTNAYTTSHVVEERMLMAQSKAEMLAWVDREPDNRIIHRPFETHQFFLAYKSTRGAVERVTVEFVYRNGLLENWFVYHDE